jgi:hypothetical protein
MTVKEVYDLDKTARSQRYEQYRQQGVFATFPLTEKSQRLATLTPWVRYRITKAKTVDRALEEMWQITVSAEDVEAFPEYEGMPIEPWLEMYFELRWELGVWYDDTVGLEDEEQSTAL